jgi:signal transduction histidine kinase
LEGIAGRIVRLLREIGVGGRSRSRETLALAAIVVGSAAATLIVAVWPGLHLAYRLAAFHVALETAASIVALIAAYLLVGRFQRRRRLDDLLLKHALILFGLTNAAFGVIPAVLAGNDAPPFVSWAAVFGRLLGVIALAAAAFAPVRYVRRPQPHWTLLVPAALLLGGALGLGLLGLHLPSAIDGTASPESSGRPRLVGHPAILVLQVVSMALYALAAIGFARRFRRDRDELILWLSAASIFGAFARLNYFLYPSIYSQSVYMGDMFRLLFYATIMIAAAREIHSYWHALAEAARLEERRRLARDLHDGLAQELAFVGRNVQRLDRGEEDPIVRRIKSGADRALAESRRAIAALTEPFDRPLYDAIEEAAQDVAAREGTHVAVQLAPVANVPPSVRDALVRITSEAITNAARHSGANLVRVTLENGDRLQLRIADAGRGFEPGSVRRDAFGLTSMRERTEALGGQFHVTSAPGEGTEVEVVL